MSESRNARLLDCGIGRANAPPRDSLWQCLSPPGGPATSATAVARRCVCPAIPQSSSLAFLDSDTTSTYLLGAACFQTAITMTHRPQSPLSRTCDWLLVWALASVSSAYGSLQAHTGYTSPGGSTVRFQFSCTPPSLQQASSTCQRYLPQAPPQVSQSCTGRQELMIIEIAHASSPSTSPTSEATTACGYRLPGSSTTSLRGGKHHGWRNNSVPVAENGA